MFDTLFNWVSNILDAIIEGFQNLGSWFSDLGTNIGNCFSDLGTSLKEFFTDLFVPDEEEVTSFTSSLTSKFTFIDSIKITVNEIKKLLDGTDAYPKISVDVESKYYTGPLTIIDLSFYAPYKKYGDLILTGFIYMFFVWRMYVTAASVINGESGTVGEAVSTFTKRGGN